MSLPYGVPTAGAVFIMAGFLKLLIMCFPYSPMAIGMYLAVCAAVPAARESMYLAVCAVPAVRDCSWRWDPALQLGLPCLLCLPQQLREDADLHSALSQQWQWCTSLACSRQPRRAGGHRALLCALCCRAGLTWGSGQW